MTEPKFVDGKLVNRSDLSKGKLGASTLDTYVNFDNLPKPDHGTVKYTVRVPHEGAGYDFEDENKLNKRCAHYVYDTYEDALRTYLYFYTGIWSERFKSQLKISVQMTIISELEPFNG